MLRRVLMCGAAALAVSGVAAAQSPVTEQVQVEGDVMVSGSVKLPIGEMNEPVDVTSCETDTDLCEIVLMHQRLPLVNVVGLRPVIERNVTGSLTILDPEDLDVRASPYIADQLRAVPGVGVSSSGGPGALTQIRMRGAEANHTLVLVDGIEFSDPTTGETDFGLLSTLNTSRVEVLRGEQSALYGSDAIGGVVSVETGDDTRPTGLIEFGSYGTARGQVAANGEFGVFNIGGAFSGYMTDGVDTSGLGGEEDGSEALSGLVRAGVDIGDWNLSALASLRTSEVATDPDLNFDGLLNNADRVTDSQQSLIGASTQGDTGPVNHLARVSYNTVRRENRIDGRFTGETKGERLKLSYSPSFEWQARGDQTITALVDYEREDYERVSTSAFFNDPNQSQTFETFGLAGEYRMDWGPVSFDASLRYDVNDDRFDDAFTRQFGVAYNIEAVDGRVRGGFGTGVKNPTFTELFGFFPGSFIGNPDLEPEQSQSVELGWDQQLGSFEASATIFYAELENEIVTRFTPDFRSTPANLDGTSERQGFELGARWFVLDSLSLNGALTLVESKNDTGADEIRVPGTTASLSASWTPEAWDGFRLSGALDYVGDQDDFDFGAFPARRVTLDAYTLVSASAEFPITDRLSITLRGENLADEEARDVFGFNTPGAAGFIGLKVR